MADPDVTKSEDSAEKAYAAASEAITAKEHKRVATEVEASFIRGLETLVARGETLQEYNHFLGDPDKLRWHLETFRKATPAGIRAAAATYLAPEKRVEIITMPEAPKVVSTADAPKGGK